MKYLYLYCKTRKGTGKVIYSYEDREYRVETRWEKEWQLAGKTREFKEIYDLFKCKTDLLLDPSSPSYSSFFSEFIKYENFSEKVLEDNNNFKDVVFEVKYVITDENYTLSYSEMLEKVMEENGGNWYYPFKKKRQGKGKSGYVNQYRVINKLSNEMRQSLTPEEIRKFAYEDGFYFKECKEKRKKQRKENLWFAKYMRRERNWKRFRKTQWKNIKSVS